MPSLLRIPTLEPSDEEFMDFEAFVRRAESDPYCAEVGMCFVVPPPSFSLPVLPDLPDIHRPIRQESVGSKGVYYNVYLEHNSLPAARFRDMAEHFRTVHGPPPGRTKSLEDVDRFFWKNVLFRRPLYGADMQGSLFPPDAGGQWNLANIKSILKDVGVCIPGVTLPYLYFGMFGASFAWHTEDLDLYSINFIHHGNPKTWYAIPPSQRDKFEKLCVKLYPSHFDDCKQFLRHKQALISPDVLNRHGLRIAHGYHFEGQFAIVFPAVYHAGFNHGFNLAESVNFATPRWLPYGRRAGRCKCIADSVEIDFHGLELLLEGVQSKDGDLDQDEKSLVPCTLEANRGLPGTDENQPPDGILIDHQAKAEEPGLAD
mmetsp:Transcript_15904/g.31891  ORF Transcript_15904/g.31891 Transcript_15904/m.31891 type:complete len:372 (-) Transcript_15904:5378-6493(-)